MPANLPPQYHEAEKHYRLAKSIPERIEALEAMLSIMPKHKGTDKLRAELRRKIAKLSEEAQRKPTIGRRGIPYVRKEGAGQAILVGLPNVGKSQLVSSVTSASPDVADYPFTTKSPIPAMMKFENVQIQLLDMPPITDSAARAWFSGTLRNTDVLLLVVDLGYSPISQLESIIEELEKLRIKPVGREAKGESEQWVVQKKAIVLGSKDDLENSSQSHKELDLRYGAEFPIVSTSAQEGAGLEEMKRQVYDTLNIIRVYTKAPGKNPDFDEPVVLRRGSTAEDFAKSIHKDFRSKLKYAQLWGSGKYNGQRVKRDHILEDGDVLELHVHG